MMSFSLAVFIAVALSRFGLSWLNLRHLQREGHVVPSVLTGSVDSARLARMSAYTAARSRLGLLRSVLSALIIGAFLFGGGLGWYDAWASRVAPSFIGNGLVFLAGLL